MSDRNDPRVRELTYRLMGMAPDAPQFPEEATMQVPETKQRTPMLVWAAAAAAVVLLVGVPLILFRGGGTVDSPVGTTVAASPTSTVPATTMTVPGTTSAPAVPTTQPPMVFLPIETSGDCQQDWEQREDRDVGTWYVFFGCDRPGMEDVLVPRPRALKTADSREGDFAGLGAAMSAQLAGPTEAETAAGYYAFNVAADGVVSPDSTIQSYGGPDEAEFDFIDFRSNPGMANASASAASTQLLAQLTSAAFQFPTVDSATFTFSGDCDSFWNWLQRDCTQVERSDWENGEITARLAAWWEAAFVPTPTTTEPPTTSSTTTTLPGEASDFGPAAGQVVGVVGVAYDDVLNVRQGPGAGYEIVTTLDPLADDVVGTGRNRFIPGAFWSEVESNGVVGWVNQRFIAYLGLVDDATSRIVNNLGGVPEAETMVELGTIVAESLAYTEEGVSRIVMVVAPTVGDVGEVTFDVIGLADDSQHGLRVHVFGQPTEGGEGFSLMSAEETALCGRGVTEEGFCV
jgi:hypothetical protein